MQRLKEVRSRETSVTFFDAQYSVDGGVLVQVVGQIEMAPVSCCPCFGPEPFLMHLKQGPCLVTANPSGETECKVLQMNQWWRSPCLPADAC